MTNTNVLRVCGKPLFEYNFLFGGGRKGGLGITNQSPTQQRPPVTEEDWLLGSEKVC